MKLKADKKLRNQWFVPEAMSHPAKGHLGLWWEMFERYTKPGEWVLDPMAGIGSSMIGAMMGRNVICNEMEPHFVEPMKASWAKMRQQVMLGCELGQVVIIQGDARCLPLRRADAAIFSPPWGDSVQSQDAKFLAKLEEQRNGSRFQGGNRTGYTRPVDVVVTSPPYEGSIQGEPGIDFAKIDSGKRDMTKEAAYGTRVATLSGYTRPAAVITSPPYEGIINAGGEGPGMAGNESQRKAIESGSPTELAAMSRNKGYSVAGSNIGNLRGNAYWEAMRLVYAECHRVLAPGGVMVLVVKGYTRSSEYVDLPQKTVDECQALGFKLQERWDRELWGLSFWRILQGTTKQTRQVALQMGLTEESTTEIIETKRVNNGKVDERLRFEPVLVLKKV